MIAALAVCDYDPRRACGRGCDGNHCEEGGEPGQQMSVRMLQRVLLCMLPLSACFLMERVGFGWVVGVGGVCMLASQHARE